MEDTTVIIPAAGLVSESLIPLSGKLCPAMVPVNGKPVIYWTISYLKELGFKKFVIAVRNHESFVEDFIHNVFGHSTEISFVIPDRDRGLAYTILSCGKNVETQKVLIILGDTYFQFPENIDPNSENSYVLFSFVKESYRWCLVEMDDQNIVSRFIDKPKNHPNSMKALIGVYNISDWPAFLNNIEQAVREKPDCQNAEMSDALSRYIKDHTLYACYCENWYDCGNPDNLIRSRKKLMQQREFNNITFNETLGTITKYSQHRAKFVNEIEYYQLLPKELKIFFPRIVDYESHSQKPFITMEYYGYPTLMELFVFENLNPRIWQQIFEYLFQVIKEFRKYRRTPDKNNFEFMYIQRTEERIRQLMESNEQISSLINNYEHLVINGKTCQNFHQLWPNARKMLHDCARQKDFTIVHGDLCFSNILFDLNSRICKFIDPRGSFGQKGVYGDIKYDVAKLYHSVHGQYDFIINDFFQLNVDNNYITFDNYPSSCKKNIRNMFDQIFFREFNKEEILLLEGLLFLSIPVFHYDYPQRQMAMFLTGIQIWNELMNPASVFPETTLAAKGNPS